MTVADAQYADHPMYRPLSWHQRRDAGTNDVAAYIKARVVVTDSGCWEWQLHITWNGYGRAARPKFLMTNRCRVIEAHRLSYMAFKGDIPPGMHIDHLCSNRKCVNPEHLEPVTHLENVRRSAARGKYKKARTGCVRGHGETAMIPNGKNGKRTCGLCRRANQQVSQ